MNGQEWVECYSHDVYGEGQGGHRYEYVGFPEVTLLASTEAGRRESSTPVLKQQFYTGSKPVISSSLANTPCASLGVKRLLRKLNSVLNTSYTMEIHSLSSLLKCYIMNDYDFGTVYGHLRPFWYNDLTDIKHKLQARDRWDRKMRRDVLVDNKIISPLIPPRRVWDLYSNRVVPWWVARRYPWAISHAWMDEKDRMDEATPINGYEWPVPMPRDADLDLIRIEMLNNGAEYAWLDVLCLKQKGECREGWQEQRAGRRVERHARLHDRRAERLDRDLQRLEERVRDRCTEWKVDVPTIGRVYQMARENQLVCYLSGLGRPFSLKKDDLQSDRCWFRRSWTLQEVNNAVIIGGDTGDDRFIEEEMRTWVDKKLSSLEESIDAGGMGMPVFIALSKMQKRVATNLCGTISGGSVDRTDRRVEYDI